MTSALPKNLHVAWSRLFVRALAAAGITDVVVSPGSRSTPLTLAVAEEPRLAAHVIIDERSAGFFALGLARRTERPVALICTSGTAGAHYFPALLEASEAHVPLLVITADRPWEAYGNASSQTMDQTKLFGDHVRHYAELGLPDGSLPALRGVGRIAAQAVAATQWPVPGPVHVNARFRKPLEPEGRVSTDDWPPALRALLDVPSPAFVPPAFTCDAGAIDRLVAVIANARNGIVAVGPLSPSRREIGPVLDRFASRLGFTVFAEATSQQRFGQSLATSIASFDALLRVPRLRDDRPDVFVEIGRPLVSSAYLAYRERHADVPGLRLAAAGWPDPTNTADVLLGPVAPLLEGALERLTVRSASPKLAAFREADEVAQTLLQAEIAGAAFTEGQVIDTVRAQAPAGAVLFVGNSSPVRDLDLYGAAGGVPITVLHQRGVAGIDGLVAGTFGCAEAATPTNAPVIGLLGDVSLAHDIGSLALARAVSGTVVLLAIDNGGGRIFGELPIAERGELRATFDRFFTTPPGLDFVAIARAFGVRATEVRTRAELAGALGEALRSVGVTLLVARVDVPVTSPRRALVQRLVAALEPRSREEDAP